MNVFKSAGFVIGIVIGLIACVVLFKISNTNHKSKTEYDERQQVIRGKAYRYAFYVLAVYEETGAASSSFAITSAAN